MKISILVENDEGEPMAQVVASGFDQAIGLLGSIERNIVRKESNQPLPDNQDENATN